MILLKTTTLLTTVNRQRDSPNNVGGGGGEPGGSCLCFHFQVAANPVENFEQQGEAGARRDPPFHSWPHTHMAINFPFFRHGRLVCHALVNLFEEISHPHPVCVPGAKLCEKKSVQRASMGGVDLTYGEARLDLQVGDLNRIISPPSLAPCLVRVCVL